MGSQLFKTKSPDLLMAEAAAPDRQMKRTLTAFDLTCIGIGAVIGTGIFALIGTAIAGQTFPTRLETPILNFVQAWLSGTDVILGRAGAGPAIAISLIGGRVGLWVRCALLCRACLHDSSIGLSLHVFIRDVG